jgi:hypothetical protein
MKKVILLAFLTSAAVVGYSQSFDQPKNGAKIYLSSYEVDIYVGEEAKIDIWVVRSKKAKNATFDAPKFLGTNDLDIKIESDPNDSNHFIATINSDGVENGKYFYTVASRSRSIQKVTGTTISFNLRTTTPAVSKNN